MALITLTAGDDALYGDDIFAGTGLEVAGAAGRDTIFGSVGNDTLYGDKGDDTISGGLGADVIYGGAGNDSLRVTDGEETVWGGSGDDFVQLVYQGQDLAGVYLQGGNGFDTLSLSLQVEDLLVVRVGPAEQGVGLTIGGSRMEAVGFEKLTLLAQEIDFVGGDEIDDISINGGLSRVFLGGGDDLLEVFPVLPGGSVFDGGLGRDKLFLDFSQTGTRALFVSQAMSGTYTLGNAVSSFADFEEITIRGSEFRDRLDFSASGVKVTFEGGESVGFDHDLILGGSRGSWLSGGSGRDTITGGGNDDTITGGSGADKLTGGYGADVFIFERAVHSLSSGGDVIFDFASDDMAGAGFGDTLDLSQVRANAGLSALTFIGEAAFTAAGQVRAVDAIDGVLVQVNTQGTGTAEMVIKLAGLADAGMIQASDFLL